jgi:hypothetical protein
MLNSVNKKQKKNEIAHFPSRVYLLKIGLNSSKFLTIPLFYAFLSEVTTVSKVETKEKDGAVLTTKTTGTFNGSFHFLFLDLTSFYLFYSNNTNRRRTKTNVALREIPSIGQTKLRQLSSQVSPDTFDHKTTGGNIKYKTESRNIHHILDSALFNGNFQPFR